MFYNCVSFNSRNSCKRKTVKVITMILLSDDFQHNERIPTELAFCAPDPESHATLSNNQNPHLTWKDVPEGTKSFVIICNDPDVPSKPDDVNQEGRTISSDLPRVDFCHWVVVDVPALATSIARGSHADGTTPGGKNPADAPGTTRHGINDYTAWFAGDADMGGDYYGYDGPCPPWNDSIIHHYHFTLYALDIERTPVEGKFTAQEVLNAIDGHTLATATLTGTYSMNPDVS